MMHHRTPHIAKRAKAVARTHPESNAGSGAGRALVGAFFLLLFAALFAAPSFGGTAETEGKSAQEQADFSLLPADEQGLNKLEFRHTALIRRAERTCGPGPLPIDRRGYRSPCIVQSVDNSVREAEDDALTAFHFALPPRVRYDSDRTRAEWRREIAKLQATGDDA